MGNNEYHGCLNKKFKFSKCLLTKGDKNFLLLEIYNGKDASQECSLSNVGIQHRFVFFKFSIRLVGK